MTIQKPKAWKVIGGSALATSIALGTYFEGERLTAYFDVGGTPTICDGETHGVYMGMTASHEECVKWLSDGMRQRLDFVNSHFFKPQPPGVQAAFADFAYNEGEGRLLRSGAIQSVNLGHVRQGCAALLKYDVAAGKVMAGLQHRRQAEYQVCMEGVQ